MANKYILNNAVAKAWIENPSLIPSDWSRLFSEKHPSFMRNQRFLKALALGFVLSDEDGEKMEDPFTLACFENSAENIYSVTVYTSNPEAEIVNRMIATVSSGEHYFDGAERFVQRNLIHAARDYLEIIPRENCTHFNYDDYLAFYATGVAHKVRKFSVSPEFFKNHPLAAPCN